MRKTGEAGLLGGSRGLVMGVCWDATRERVGAVAQRGLAQEVCDLKQWLRSGSEAKHRGMLHERVEAGDGGDVDGSIG
jgi:hypothetical protein